MSAPTFTIRVYGLLLVQQQILLSREHIRGRCYTKFPGGGLEYGEGTLDCLRREWQEEASLAIEPIAHFYTTEDFVPSAFGAHTQVISIYYTVKAQEWDKLPVVKSPEDHQLLQDGDQQFFWRPMASLSPQDVDLPIDREVVRRLLAQR